MLLVYGGIKICGEAKAVCGGFAVSFFFQLVRTRFKLFVLEGSFGNMDSYRATDPGVIFDLDVDDYVNFLCSSNYSQESIELITNLI